MRNIIVHDGVVHFFVLLGLCAACGGEQPSSQALPAQGIAAEPTAAAARLARAPAATTAAGTALIAITATVAEGPGRENPLTFGGEGVIDFAAGRSRSILDLSAALDMATSGRTELETVTAGGVTYVRAPALSSLQGGSRPSKSWVRIPAARSGSEVNPLRPLGRLAGSDPGAPMALLAGLDASSVRELRNDHDADEVITTLSGTVDVLAASAGQGAPDDLAALEALLERVGARQLQVEADLDEDDRLRRLVYEHLLAHGAGHQRLEVRYRDFGAEVEIDVPAETEVRDFRPGTLQGPR